MSRGNRWPDWELQEDGYLDEPVPEPDPPPQKRGTGCAWFAAALTLGLLIVASSVVAAPRTAGHVIPAADRLLPPRDDGWSVSGNLDRLSGAPDHGVGVSPVTLAGAPQPSGEVGPVLIGGWASWYDDPRKTGLYAAAGPLLREALGDWRGKVIRVTAGNRVTLVVLSDFCQCGERHGIPTIIDLSPDAFADLAPLSQGLVRVEIEVLALPATDTPDQHPQDPPEHPDDARMRLEDR